MADDHFLDQLPSAGAVQSGDLFYVLRGTTDLKTTAADVQAFSAPIASANVTYYVNADSGSDSNAGTSGSPFLTQKKAWNTICGINGNGFTATIQLQNATALYERLNVSQYGSGETTKTPVGWAQIIIQGNLGDFTKVKIWSGNGGSNICYGFSKITIPITIQAMTWTSNFSVGVDPHGLSISAGSVVIAKDIIVTDIDFYIRSEYGAQAYCYNSWAFNAGSLQPRNVLLAQNGGYIEFTPFGGFTTDGNVSPFAFAESRGAGTNIHIFVNAGVVAGLTGFNGHKFWATAGGNVYAIGGDFTNVPGALAGLCEDCGTFETAPGITESTGVFLVPAPVLDNTTVANLPATCLEGSTALVTDSAAAPVALSAVSGGGATKVPVIYLGGAWKYMTGTSGAAATITVGTTAVASGTTGRLLYDNAGTLGEAIVGSGLTLSAGTLSASGGSGLTVGTTAIASGTANHVLYEDGSNKLGEAANFTISSGNPNVTSGNAYLYNTANALRAVTAHFSWFFGPSGNMSVSGDYNTCVGQNAGTALGSGSENTFVGFQSGQNCSTGVNNCGLGVNTLNGITSGGNNCAIGENALLTEQTGSFNMAMGHRALTTQNGASSNVGIGDAAGVAVTTGSRNMFIGSSAGNTITTESDNVMIGYQAGSSAVGVSNCVFLGAAGGAATGGANCVAIVLGALSGGNSGDNNIAIGDNALSSNTSGADNTGIARNALQHCSSSPFNVGIGTGALSGVTTGSGNSIGIGRDAGNTITTGEHNIVIGAQATAGVTTGSFNTIIGAQISGLSTSLANNVIIADGQGNIRIKHDATDIYLKNSAAFATRYLTTLTNNAAANTATLTNAPAAGNPTKWFAIDDNGVTRYIPAW